MGILWLAHSRNNPSQYDPVSMVYVSDCVLTNKCERDELFLGLDA